MANNDSTCLIDWNSPVVEFSCQPLIPLPKFDGQVQINGDNPFDDLEMQINENGPFDFVLNRSLNSSLEQPDLDKSMEMTNDVRKPAESLVEGLDKMNLNVEPSFSGKYSSINEENVSMNISSINVSYNDDDIKTLKHRLSLLRDRLSFGSNEDLQPVTNMPVEHAGFKNSSNSVDANGMTSENVSSMTNSIVNKGFVGKSLINDTKDFDSLSMWNVNSLDEDLSTIIPVWDEIGFVSSSSEEECDDIPVKSVSLESITGIKNVTNRGKVFKKTADVRLPLGVKDPNIRAKKPAIKVVRDGPLRAVIPIESMTKNVNRKLDQTPTLQNRFSRKLKADSTSLKQKRRSAPIATSTPTTVREPKIITNNSKVSGLRQIKRSALPTRSCPPSPDSTTTVRISSKVINSSLLKGCSRKLALNAVSSSSGKYPVNVKKISKDMKSPLMKSTVTKRVKLPVEATGVKSCVKNKENIVPFRY